MSRPVLFLHGGNVGGWMWQPQVEALGDRPTIAPDLPAYGERRGESWTSFDAVADRLADVIDDAGGSVDLVGMSLGGVVSLHLAARHPDRVASVFVTGASVLPFPRVLRAINLLQIAAWNRRFYWAGVARAFGLSGDEAARFVASSPSITRDNLRVQLREVYPGRLVRPERIRAPFLAVAGAKELPYFHRSLRAIRAANPRAAVGLAPGVHHGWNGEDPALFNRILRTWLDDRAPEPALLPLDG